MHFNRAFCTVFVFPVFIFSQKLDTVKLEPLCVTANRSETQIREIGSSLTIVDQAEIEKKQSRTVLEALRNIPGLDVVQTGGPGQHASVFIRGANSEHTLVMVDGIIMNDPMSAGRSFSFDNLTTENIDRIEILRGPQSTLYGSDAIGGVINIISKKGHGKTSFSLSGEAGSYGTFIEKAGISGSSGALDYSIGATQVNSQGISAAGTKYGNTEKDGYKNSSAFAHAGFFLSDFFNAGLSAKASNARSDLDNWGGAGGDDLNNSLDASELYIRPFVNVHLFNKKWTQEVGFAVSEHTSVNSNFPDSAHPMDSLRTSLAGQLVKTDWKNTITLFSTTKALAGVEFEKETGTYTNYSRSPGWIDSARFSPGTLLMSAYLQAMQSISRSFFGTLGARIDNSDKFGNEITYRATAAYVFAQWNSKIKATYGSGFKAPSLYQLYSIYGDKSLQPEKSNGVDCGIEQHFCDDKLFAEFSAYYNEYRDLIDFNSVSSTYGNVSKAQIKGGEFNVGWKPEKYLTLSAQGTYTNTKNLITGKHLLERPKYKGGFVLDCQPMTDLAVHGDFMYTGERMDYPYQRMNGYNVVDIAASYSFSSHLSVYGRIDNLFDTDYEAVQGYATPGVSGYGGVKVTF